MKPHLSVTAGIICKDNQFLCVRRRLDKSQGGLWEFPGGKVEPGEQPEQCLVRELREELDIETQIVSRFMVIVHEYADKIVELDAYFVDWLSGEIQLVDHDDLRWLPKDQLDSLDWSPADVPIIKALQKGD